MKLYIARFVSTAGLVGGVALAAIGCIGGDASEVEFASEKVDEVSQGLALYSSLGTPVYSGTTCGLNNGVTPGCTTSNASDMSFTWTAPTSRTFVFSTSNTNFDNVLLISSYLNPATILACRDGARSAGGESVSLALAAGQQIIITVDGYTSLCGNYSLNFAQVYLSCTWNGKTYAHGMSTTGGGACDKWGSQTCVGGIWDGKACVGGGDCYATCDDGTWVDF